MANLTREELSILRKYQNEITTMPNREASIQYHQERYTPWQLVDTPKQKEKKKIRMMSDENMRKMRKAHFR